jgi:NAD(P)-binding Rossmann-like domain
MRAITVIGGGIAGLVASIACAEGGGQVRLIEAHRRLGGRARSSAGPFVTNLGPDALYCDGPWWAWLAERQLLPPVARPPLTGARFRLGPQARRMPPPALLARAIRLRRERAPIELDFRSWAADRFGAERAATLAAAAGVFSFDADPGRLSAAFVWERLLRVNHLPSPVRYVQGGRNPLVERLERRARALGVAIETGARVDALPEPPVIVATELDAARQLLGDESLHWEGAHTVVLDVGLRADRGDPWIVYDLEQAGFAERFTAHDGSRAPPGHELIQAHIGRRPGEPAGDATSRLEALLDTAFDGWRHAPSGRGARDWNDARERSICRQPLATIARRSTAATGCSSPATWWPRRGCSPRSPSTARSTPADAPCTGNGTRRRRPIARGPTRPRRRRPQRHPGRCD